MRVDEVTKSYRKFVGGSLPHKSFSSKFGEIRTKHPSRITAFV